MEIILYSNNCPKCKILKKKLDDKNIVYEAKDDIDFLISNGFRGYPVLSVNKMLMGFGEGIEWTKKQELQ